MKIELNKETMKHIGEVSLKLGKNIVIEGTKAVALKAAAKAINVGFEDGFDGVKNIKLDDVLNSNKRGKDKPKKKWFAKKEDLVEDLIEEIVANPDAADDVVEVVDTK